MTNPEYIGPERQLVSSTLPEMEEAGEFSLAIIVEKEVALAEALNTTDNLTGEIERTRGDISRYGPETGERTARAQSLGIEVGALDELRKIVVGGNISDADREQIEEAIEMIGAGAGRRRGGAVSVRTVASALEQKRAVERKMAEPDIELREVVQEPGQAGSPRVQFNLASKRGVVSEVALTRRLIDGYGGFKKLVRVLNELDIQYAIVDPEERKGEAGLEWLKDIRDASRCLKAQLIKTGGYELAVLAINRIIETFLHDADGNLIELKRILKGEHGLLAEAIRQRAGGAFVDSMVKFWKSLGGREGEETISGQLTLLNEGLDRQIERASRNLKIVEGVLIEMRKNKALDPDFQEEIESRIARLELKRAQSINEFRSSGWTRKRLLGLLSGEPKGTDLTLAGEQKALTLLTERMRKRKPYCEVEDWEKRWNRGGGCSATIKLTSGTATFDYENGTKNRLKVKLNNLSWKKSQQELLSQRGGKALELEEINEEIKRLRDLIAEKSLRGQVGKVKDWVATTMASFDYTHLYISTGTDDEQIIDLQGFVQGSKVEISFLQGWYSEIEFYQQTWQALNRLEKQDEKGNWLAGMKECFLGKVRDFGLKGILEKDIMRLGLSLRQGLIFENKNILFHDSLRNLQTAAILEQDNWLVVYNFHWNKRRVNVNNIHYLFIHPLARGGIREQVVQNTLRLDEEGRLSEESIARLPLHFSPALFPYNSPSKVAIRLLPPENWSDERRNAAVVDPKQVLQVLERLNRRLKKEGPRKQSLELEDKISRVLSLLSGDEGE